MSVRFKHIVYAVYKVSVRFKHIVYVVYKVSVRLKHIVYVVFSYIMWLLKTQVSFVFTKT